MPAGSRFAETIAAVIRDALVFIGPFNPKQRHRSFRKRTVILSMFVGRFCTGYEFVPISVDRQHDVA